MLIMMAFLWMEVISNWNPNIKKPLEQGGKK